MNGSNVSAQVLAAIRSVDPSSHTLPNRICNACVASLPVDGAALSLIRKGAQRERVGASDETAGQVEDLQITLGEGPSVQALETGRVLVSDLAGQKGRGWPAFAAAVADTGVRAAFVLPLQLGAVRLGALSLYRKTPGPLLPEALSDALRVADVIAMLFLGSEGDLTADFADIWLDRSSWTREVHQATGMLIVQLSVGAEEAFVRLRAHAFAHELALRDVAIAVVDGSLRFEDDSS